MTAPASLLSPHLAAPPVFSWSPAFGPALIVLGVAAVIGLGVWGALRRGRGWGVLTLRIAAAGALGAVLLGPQRTRPAPDESTRPGVIYMLDTSASMGLTDHPNSAGPCTRLDALRRSWLDAGALQRVSDAADLRLMSFDERAAPVTFAQAQTISPEGERTRLVECSADVLSRLGQSEEDRAGAVSDAVLLTDGIDTDGAPLAPLAGLALASGVRLHAVVVGRDQQPADVSIQAAADSTLVYDGQPTTLRLRLRASGFDNRPARVTVRELSSGVAAAGVPGTAPEAGGRVVFSETVLLARSVDLAVPVTPSRDPSRDEGGGVTLVEYVARVEPMTGEADESNNTRRTFVQVAGDRIRVCLFENEPYWDSRFFIAAMRDDPQVELTTVMGLGATRQGPRTEPHTLVTRYVPGAASSEPQRLDRAPLRDEDLAEFDIIALGKGVEAFFPGEEARKLVRFTAERGGSLVFLRGRPTTGGDSPAVLAGQILDAASPVEWGNLTLRGTRLARTPEGMREPALDFERLGPSDAILSELPGMLAATSIEREKALSVVWLRQSRSAEDGTAAGPRGANEPAALAHMSVGKGRAFAVLTDGLWRWAFLPPEKQDFAGVYRLFWSRAVRWLALGGDFLPGQSVSLVADKLSTSPGEPVTIAARARYAEPGGFTPSLTITGPDGTSTPVALQRVGAGQDHFTAAWTPKTEGVYTAELRAPGMTPERLLTRFAAYDDRPELRDTAARPDEMLELCRSTGGRLFALDETDALIDLLSKEGESRRSVVKPVPAWDSAWLFGVIASLLTAEWFWRRRIGLP